MLYMDLLGLYWPRTNIILTGPYITYRPRKKSIIDNNSLDNTKYEFDSTLTYRYKIQNKIEKRKIPHDSNTSKIQS